MFNPVKLKFALTAALISATALGCGSAVRDNSAKKTDALATTPATNSSNPSTSTPNPLDPPPGVNFVPTFTSSFSFAGSSSHTTNAIDADNKLRVKIDAGSAGTIVFPGSNFSGTYGCLAFNVRLLAYNGTAYVESKTVATKIMAVNGGSQNCPGAPASDIIDFSDRLGPGHDNYKIKVDSAKYDFYCQHYDYCSWNYWALGGAYGSCSWIQYASRSNYCPVKTVYSTHTVSGTLEVEINGSMPVTP